MVEPLEEGVDRVRWEAGATVILGYGDYECPYSRQAFQRVVRGTATLFVDGHLYGGGYEPAALIEALAR